jgi:hypothetical protein
MFCSSWGLADIKHKSSPPLSGVTGPARPPAQFNHTRLGSPASPRKVPVDAVACRAFRDPRGETTPKSKDNALSCRLHKTKKHTRSGNTTLHARGPVYGSSEHYTFTLRLALSHACGHKGAPLSLSLVGAMTHMCPDTCDKGKTSAQCEAGKHKAMPGTGPCIACPTGTPPPLTALRLPTVYTIRARGECGGNYRPYYPTRRRGNENLR